MHTLQNVQLWFTCLLLRNAEMHNFKLWSEDAPQAYTQADKQLARLVIIDDVPPESGLKNSECRQVVKPVYGLSDSEDHWYITIHRHHRGDVDKVLLASDPGLFDHINGGTLCGLNGLKINDVLCTEEKHFASNARLLQKNLVPELKRIYQLRLRFYSDWAPIGMVAVSQKSIFT